MWKGTQASVPSIAERPTDRAVSGGMARSTRTQLYRPVSWFSGLGTGSRPRWTALGAGSLRSLGMTACSYPMQQRRSFAEGTPGQPLLTFISGTAGPRGLWTAWVVPRQTRGAHATLTWHASGQHATGMQRGLVHFGRCAQGDPNGLSNSVPYWSHGHPYCLPMLPQSPGFAFLM